MVKKALSNNVKRLQKRTSDENRVLLAAEAYKMAKNTSAKKSLRVIADTYNVNYSTLLRRVHDKGNLY